MSRKLKYDKSAFSIEEIWQTQRYWPITGWSTTGKGQFETTNRKTFDDLPNKEILPQGWEWMNEWTVDKSNSFGECDEDGWTYAPTMESLLEAYSNGKTVGEMTALSLVRRRRFIRSRICISFSLRESIESRMKLLMDTSQLLESHLKDKKEEFIALKEYEKARSLICRSGYSRISNEAQRYILGLKTFLEKLTQLYEFLVEKTTIEYEYSKSIRGLCKMLIPPKIPTVEEKPPLASRFTFDSPARSNKKSVSFENADASNDSKSSDFMVDLLFGKETKKKKNTVTFQET
jgi:hypothetical protein